MLHSRSSLGLIVLNKDILAAIWAVPKLALPGTALVKLIRVALVMPSGMTRIPSQRANAGEFC